MSRRRCTFPHGDGTELFVHPWIRSPWVACCLAPWMEPLCPERTHPHQHTHMHGLVFQFYSPTPMHPHSSCHPSPPWMPSAELTLEDTLTGYSPPRCLLLVEAAMRSHRQVPAGLLRGPRDAQIHTARELSALVPPLALASLSAVNQRSQGSGASSCSSGSSLSVDGFPSVLSALCTVRKVSASMMSRYGTEMDGEVWDGILSGVLLESIHAEDESISSSLGGPGAGGAALLLGSGACCPAAHLIQHRTFALSLATAAMVHLLPPICSGVLNDLGKCLAFIKAEPAGSVDKAETCQVAIRVACGSLGEWSRTLAWACSGPWMPGYPEHGAEGTSDRYSGSGTCHPVSGTDPDSDPAQEPVAPGCCDRCTSSFAFERGSSLALVVGAVGVSRAPQLLGEAGKWLGMLLGSVLEVEAEDSRALALDLSQHLAHSLQAVLGLAAAAVEVSLLGDPMMHSDDACSDGAADRAELSVGQASAAARAACHLVVEILQCGLLQQLASVSMLQLGCVVTATAAEAADPLALHVLDLVPVLFNLLTLSLTQCIRALAASVEEGGILGCSGYGLQCPSEGPDDRISPAVEGLRCIVDRCVSRCSDGVEVLAIASCKLAVASTTLQNVLRDGLPANAEPRSTRKPPAEPRAGSRARPRCGVGLTPPQGASGAVAAERPDAALGRCHSLVVSLLGETLER